MGQSYRIAGGPTPSARGTLLEAAVTRLTRIRKMAKRSPDDLRLQREYRAAEVLASQLAG